MTKTPNYIDQQWKVVIEAHFLASDMNAIAMHSNFQALAETQSVAAELSNWAQGATKHLTILDSDCSAIQMRKQIKIKTCGEN